MRKVAGLTVALFLVLGACSADTVAEKVIESQDGAGDVSVNENGGSVAITVQSNDGTASGVIGGGDLPEGLPMDVPDGYTVNAVFESGDGFSASLNYPAGSYDDIVAAFQSYVESSSVSDLVSYTASNPPAINWIFTVGDQGYSISVADTGEDVIVTLIGGNG